MNWTVGKKLFLVGSIAVVGFGIMAGNNLLTGNSIKNYSEIEALRNKQIHTVNQTLQAHLTLMLNTADSINDKDTGDISKERLEAINQNIALVKENLLKIDQLSDSAEEKRLSEQLKTSFSLLSTGIQKDLITMIRESGSRMIQIQQEFNTLDDELDSYGDPIEKELSKLYLSVSQDQQNAVDSSILRNKQIGFVDEMIRAQGDLMLAAMNSIIDKEDGRIDPDRLKGMNENIAFISENIDRLDELSDTDEEREAVQIIKRNFPELVKGIRVDLRTLIESRAPQLEFEKIDDTLDTYHLPIQRALIKLYTFASEGQETATDLLILRNTQSRLLSKLVQSHGSLMLSAMDAITDKDEGVMDPERIQRINEDVNYISDNLDDLIEVSDTPEERKSTGFIGDTFSKLAEGIQVDLKNLIEKSGVEADRIQAAFAKIDDDLDEYGHQVEKSLLGIQASVRKDVIEAQEATRWMLTRSKFVGWVTTIVVLTVLLAALILISRSIIGPITRISGELREGANQVSSASEQVSSSSQSLAEGASTQAAAIEETSSSMEEMSSMTKKNAENALNADTLMKEANRVVEDADRSMAQLTKSMDDISKASEETSKIIKTIDEIAFQTNLLALNAAVEAARAGEAGAGFAVVADEVRNLAMRAADAAKDTAVLIEGTVKKVDDGGRLVSATNEAFGNVAKSTATVGSLVEEISAASKEQSNGIDQVNNAIMEMDKVVQQNAANAEESASASEELNAQAFQMKETVSHLVSLIISKDGKEKKRSAGKKIKAVGTSSAAVAAGSGRPGTPSKEIGPDQLLPFDDDKDESFKDF